jgi:hypothetical protein
MMRATIRDDSLLAARPSWGSKGSVRFDERGAVSILGLFFAIFLIAMTFYILGIARTLLAQEGMQDAADSGSYASAIIHARGMNLIVYLNFIMAALIAVLIAIRLVQSLFAIAAVMLFAVAFFSGGSSIVLAQQCLQEVQVWQKNFERAKDVVYPTLKGLHTAEIAISYIVPAAATLDALVESGKTHGPADAVFALPGRIQLPVEADSFSVLCEKGGETAASFATLPLKEMGGDVEKVAEDLGGAIGEMSKSLSGFLCGDGKGEPPSHSVRIKKEYPSPPASRDCVTDAECEAAQEEAAQKSDEYEATKIKAAPNSDGTCPGSTTDGPCPPTHPYEIHALEARSSCLPREGITIESTKYVEQTVTSTYVMTTQGRVEQKREVNSSAIREGHLPCAKRQSDRSGWSVYETRGWSPNSRYANPVCKRNHVQVGGRVGAGPAEVRDTIVSHVLSCIVWETKVFPLAKRGETLNSRDNDKRSPMRVEKGLDLGEEDFQIRAIAYGEAVGPGKYLAGVQLARWKQEPAADRTIVTDVMSLLHHFSAAQGEYYFDDEGTIEADEWMWQAAWTARLRRFRFPKDDESKGEAQAGGHNESHAYGGLEPGRTVQDSCGASGAAECDQMSSILAEIEEEILH